MVSKHSYLQKREERDLLKSKAGLVSEHFPGVESIAFHLTYRQRGAGLPLMQRTMHFRAASPALFRMDCLQDECAHGAFDLTDVVKALVKGRKSGGKGRLACSSTRSEGNGHMSLAYEVAISYCAASPSRKKAGSR